MLGSLIQSDDAYGEFFDEAVQREDFEGARRWFEQAKSNGMEIGHDSETAFLSLCIKSGDPDYASDMLEKAFDDGDVEAPDMVNRFVVRLVDAGEFVKARAWAERAAGLGIKLDADTYETVLWAARRDVSVQQGDCTALEFWLEGAMLSGTLSEKVPLVNDALFELGKKAKNFSRVERLAHLGIGAGVPLSGILATMLNLAAEDGDLRSTEAWLQRSMDEGIPVSLMNFNLLIKAALNAGQTTTAERIFTRAATYGVAPDLVTFTTFVRSAARTGDLATAEEWYERATEAGIRGDVFIYNTLIDAASKAGNLAAAERWFQQIAKDGEAPNDVSFDTLMYAAMKFGRPWQVEELYRQRVAANIKLTTFGRRTMRWALGKLKLSELLKEMEDPPQKDLFEA